MARTKTRFAILSGWKQIADYLDKGVRTVQRYEREFGLPVRRPAGRSKGAVIATKAELDAWISATPVRHAFQLNRPALTRVPLDDLRRHLAEMRRLREETSELHTKIAASLDLLRNNLRFPIPADLQADTNPLRSTSDNVVIFGLRNRKVQ